MIATAIRQIQTNIMVESVPASICVKGLEKDKIHPEGQDLQAQTLLHSLAKAHILSLLSLQKYPGQVCADEVSEVHTHPPGHINWACESEIARDNNMKLSSIFISIIRKY
jgi:hypothetical protein